MARTIENDKYTVTMSDKINSNWIEIRKKTDDIKASPLLFVYSNGDIELYGKPIKQDRE